MLLNFFSISLTYFALCNLLVNTASVLTSNRSINEGQRANNYTPFVDETDDEQFNRTDVSGDGLISFNEFLKFDKYELEMKQQEFNYIDKNGDGNLNRSETDAYNTEWREEENAWKGEFIYSAIENYDLNSNSKLSAKEVLNYLRDYYMLKPNEKTNFEDIFKKFDKNDDNELDESEMEYFTDNIPYDDFDYIDYEDTNKWRR